MYRNITSHKKNLNKRIKRYLALGKKITLAFETNDKMHYVVVNNQIKLARKTNDK
jgi:hypothetical protein